MNVQTNEENAELQSMMQLVNFINNILTHLKETSNRFKWNFLYIWWHF